MLWLGSAPFSSRTATIEVFAAVDRSCMASSRSGQPTWGSWLSLFHLFIERLNLVQESFRFVVGGLSPGPSGRELT